jgi:lipoate-protein ligase A
MRIADERTDPAFNLAAEEWLMGAEEPVLRLWRNSPCLVAGRHQILCREADLPEAARRNVPVLRRDSGGGTVYHDMGNLLFTILTAPGEKPSIDFDRMSAPVLAALSALGIPAEHGDKGALFYQGKKISGGAAHLKKGRLLYHGTLLFSADLAALARLLAVPGERVESRAVRSEPRAVANLAELFPGRFASVQDFAEAFGDTLARELGLSGEAVRAFSEDEAVAIETLAAKYRSAEWTLGNSPDYRAFSRGGFLLTVHEGKIAAVEGEAVSPALSDALANCWHDMEAVAEALAKIGSPLPPEAFFP